MNEALKEITITDHEDVDFFGHKVVIGRFTNAHIADVIFHPPATIVFWSDGSKTVVKCGSGEEFDAEKGLAMAIVKRVYGNAGNYNNIIHDWTIPYIEKQAEERILKDRQKFVRGLDAFHERMKQREESEEKDETGDSV